jgi:uncharacterized protein YlzI (FlbEa/FlbD family)
MIIAATMILLKLVVLHTLDGRDVFINAAHVVSIGEARDERDPKKETTSRVHCVISMLDGMRIAVEENCDNVRERLQ